MSYVIMTDSSCDLPNELAKELGIADNLPLCVSIDGVEYRNYLDERELTKKEFFSLLRQGKRAMTSAVNVDAFVGVFEPELQAGNDVLYLSFSSALSSTYNAAKMAAEELMPGYPERKLYIMDTLSGSLGQSLLVERAVMLQRAGATIDEVKADIEAVRLNVCHWFTVDDLGHLHRGGRISAATAVVGNVLNIKPVLRVDDEGRMVPFSKVRGRRAALRMLFEKAQEHYRDMSPGRIYIGHADCAEDAEQLKEMIQKNLLVKDITIRYIGAVTGAHSGPGAIGVFFMGDAR